MRDTLQLRALQWVKLTQPTEEEIRGLNEEFRLHPLVMRELLVPTIRPKVDTYHTYAYLVIHVPVFNLEDRKTYSKEIDVILTHNAIITASYQPNEPIEEFWKTITDNQRAIQHDWPAGVFLYHLIHALFAFSLRELDHIQENINTLEDILFFGNHEEISKDIYIARRDIIDFRRTLKPQGDVFKMLEQSAGSLYGSEVLPFFRNLTSEFYRMWDVLEGHKETIEELYDTNESIVSNTINKTMKVFTVLAFITFVPNVIAALFGMALGHIPLADNPYAFWIVIAVSAILTLILFLFFRARRII